MTDREAFEAWTKTVLLSVAHDPWAAWQAALAYERAKQGGSDLANRLRELANSCSNPHLYEKERTMLEAAEFIEAERAKQGEPSEEMIAEAWREAQGKCDHDTLRRIYRVFAAPPAVQEEPMRKPTHRCKVCGATWKHYGVGASLIGEAKCLECDLEPIAAHPTDDEAVRLLREAKDYLDRWEARPSLQLAIDAYLARVTK